MVAINKHFYINSVVNIKYVIYMILVLVYQSSGVNGIHLNQNCVIAVKMFYDVYLLIDQLQHWHLCSFSLPLSGLKSDIVHPWS